MAKTQQKIMTTDIIEIHNFIVLIEQSNAEKTIVQKCEVDGDVIGFAFYGSGNVELEIKYENKVKIVTNTTGIAISFSGNSKVEFSHKIAPNKPLQSISIFTKTKNLHTLPEGESAIFHEHLHQLINPQTNFVEGPSFYMTVLCSNYKSLVLITFVGLPL